MSRIRLKLSAFLLVLVFTMSLFPYVKVNAAVTDSGSCGNLTWELDDEGLLTISGTGNMPDLSYAPWYDYISSIKSVVIDSGVTSIGNYAFINCENLTSVTIPSSVTSIDKYAFGSCTSLAGITIPENVTSIGEGVFYGCTSLASITIPEAVTSISRGVFYGCTGLTNITIPDNVTSIGNVAFCNCTGITSITIPDGVTSIGDSAFYGCTNLKSITIPDSVTSIGEDAFSGCTSLASITIPETVTSISDGVFYDCTGLTNITIHDKVTSIGKAAFYNCSGITNITIPDSVTSIGWAAFYGCTNLESVTISSRLFNSEENNDDSLKSLSPDKRILYNSVDFTPSENGTVGIASRDYETGIVTLYVTPDSGYMIDEITVTDNSVTSSLNTVNGVYSVDTSNGDVTVTTTFKDDPVLASGTCGDSLTWVLDKEGLLTISGTGKMPNSYSAPWYDNRDSIKSVVITSGVTSIGDCAFNDCASLTSITIPAGVTSIGDSAFVGCESLTSITIPESVTTIDRAAFKACSSLVSITIPKNVTSIGEQAFNCCSGLTSITISDGVTSIDENAFDNCTNLTSVTIPDSVTSIGEQAFFHCTGLTSITISDSVTSIGRLTFDDCTSLTDVYYFGTPEQFEAVGFHFINGVTIHYLTPLKILTQPCDYTGTVGSKATFSVAAQGEELTYQWQMYTNGAWRNSGATGSKTSKITFNISGSHDNMQYRCIVTDKYGNEETSETVKVHVATLLSITEQPTDFTGTLGSKATFSIAAKGDDLAYQWQTLTNGVWRNSGAAGSKTSKITFNISNVHNGMEYRCVVTDRYGKEIISDTVTVHVATVLSITQQPSNVTGIVGTKATFSITVQGDDLTYQWQTLTNGAWRNSGATGSKTSKITFNISSTHDGMQYRCVVKDKYGKSLTSDTATVKVIVPLAITEQPVDYTGLAGSKATFSVTAQGEGLTYQWQALSGGTWKNSNATGSKTSKITFNVSNTHYGMKYRCVVKDSTGKTVTSNAAEVHVFKALAITQQPADYTGKVGSNASFSVTAQGDDLTYQWQVYSGGTWKNSNASGSKTSRITFKVSNTHNGMKYRCVITDKNGQSVTSNDAVIHIA
ncbi:MAG: leucine-rich repeat protein [Clostridiales bacterium]|nr:leucine-rich repeat protein [Clostridiales bacterium]